MDFLKLCDNIGENHTKEIHDKLYHKIASSNFLNHEDKNGYTPLIACSQNGYFYLVELLIKNHNIDPNYQNKYGKTALMYACHFGRIRTVKLLLSLGADVNIIIDNFGLTVFDWSQWHHYDPQLKYTQENHKLIQNILFSHSTTK